MAILVKAWIYKDVEIALAICPKIYRVHIWGRSSKHPVIRSVLLKRLRGKEYGQLLQRARAWIDKQL